MLEAKKSGQLQRRLRSIAVQEPHPHNESEHDASFVRNLSSLTVGESPGAFPQKSVHGEELTMAPKNLTSTRTTQLSPELHPIDVHILPR